MYRKIIKQGIIAEGVLILSVCAIVGIFGQNEETIKSVEAESTTTGALAEEVMAENITAEATTEGEKTEQGVILGETTEGEKTGEETTDGETTEGETTGEGTTDGEAAEEETTGQDTETSKEYENDIYSNDEYRDLSLEEEDDESSVSTINENSGDLSEDVIEESTDSKPETQTAEKTFIKWVDFNVSYQAMEDAYEYDIESHDSKVQLHWIELLAYLGAKYGGDFKSYKAKDLEAVVDKLVNQKMTMEEITADMQYYNYYNEAYDAVLGGFVGEYEIEVASSTNPEEKVWEKHYGLKAFLPIAKNFPYSDYDDFGVARSYGYRRQHLGHDMMGQVGTPIIAVESGYVEALGWNQYGGWRIGIRSFDGKRYYYYAHLRQNYPYVKNLEVGGVVQAGDVIGYLGRTGYSTKENTNNIDTPHLHFGMQLIFDESQKEGNNEIWINCYNIVKFLYQNRSETVKNTETKEWYRIFEIVDPIATDYKLKHGIHL